MSEETQCHCSHTCPLFRALDTLAKRWSILILVAIHNGHENYNTIQKNIPEINTRILSQRLKELEQEGYIDKKIDPKNSRKTHYQLNQKSLDLKPIMVEMADWAKKWDKAE